MHLSHSQISLYDRCPMAYAHRYVYRHPGKDSVPLKFGSAIDKALRVALNEGDLDSALGTFAREWTAAANLPLDYGKESHEEIRRRGTALLEVFFDEHLPRIGKVYAVQYRIERPLVDKDLYVGYLDFLGEVDGVMTLTDFKTGQRAPHALSALTSEQLDAYQWGVASSTLPAPERLALCYLIRTKEPVIEWQFTPCRAPDALQEYEMKARQCLGLIKKEAFNKRTSSCLLMGECEYLSLCFNVEEPHAPAD